MSRKMRVVAWFAAAGFVAPWLLLVCYAAAHRLGIRLSTTPLLYLCPASIASLGLDNASWLVSLLGWLLISLSNAALNSLPGAVISLLIPREERTAVDGK